MTEISGFWLNPELLANIYFIALFSGEKCVSHLVGAVHILSKQDGRRARGGEGPNLNKYVDFLDIYVAPETSLTFSAAVLIHLFCTRVWIHFFAVVQCDLPPHRSHRGKVPGPRFKPGTRQFRGRSVDILLYSEDQTPRPFLSTLNLHAMN